jgi:signal transduction histidine kinase
MSEPHDALKTWEDVQSEFLQLTSRAMLLTNVALGVVAWIEYLRTGVAFNFVTVAGILAMSQSVILKFGGLRLQQISVCVLMNVVAGLLLLQAGPFIGVGFLMVGAVLTTSLFLGRRAAFVAYLLFCLLLLVIAIQSASVSITSAWDLEPLVWRRVGIGLVVGFGIISWVLIRMFEQLKSSLEAANEVASRERELEKQKERIVKHAMQIERLESLRILAGGVAHDFNNSLVVIRAGIDMLEEVVPAEELELLKMMRESANAAAETARSLTTFSRQRRDKSETCFPASVAKNVSRRARKLFDSDIQIEWELDETPAAQIGSATFEEVLLQLLLNAKDSSPSGGIVKVHVSAIHGNVKVEVSDSGEGIPESLIDRVFEPFFTTKGEQATGLGLALVWSHVQRCGGDVHVTSKVGVGTTFTFTIPTEKTEDE